jgi:hypothetical protein
MKFVYYNDTNRLVSIHPATIIHGCEVDMNAIKPLEERVFTLPENTYPWVKMWDYGEKRGLQILVSPRSLANDGGVMHAPSEEHELLMGTLRHEIREVLEKNYKHKKEEK